MPDSQPYITKPWWAKLAEATFYVAGYLLTAVAGLMAIIYVDAFPAREGGYALVAAGLLATIGVCTRYYNLELVALWPVLTGLGAIVLWLVLNDAQVVGWLVAALIPHYARRLLVLVLIARRARRLHTMGVQDAGVV
ncbi:MAG TPA: hypothetical protein VFF10_09850 [Trueperaceae bacterium]|nr:hypothetical protein [Trueperaceae bacterium]